MSLVDEPHCRICLESFDLEECHAARRRETCQVGNETASASHPPGLTYLGCLCLEGALMHRECATQWFLQTRKSCICEVCGAEATGLDPSLRRQIQAAHALKRLGDRRARLDLELGPSIAPLTSLLLGDAGHSLANAASLPCLLFHLIFSSGAAALHAALYLSFSAAHPMMKSDTIESDSDLSPTPSSPVVHLILALLATGLGLSLFLYCVQSPALSIETGSGLPPQAQQQETEDAHRPPPRLALRIQSPLFVLAPILLSVSFLASVAGRTLVARSGSGADGSGAAADVFALVLGVEVGAVVAFGLTLGGLMLSWHVGVARAALPFGDLAEDSSEPGSDSLSPNLSRDVSGGGVVELAAEA